MRQSDKPVTVRARAFGRTGLPGDYISTTFTTVAPLIDNSQVELRLPPIDYEGLSLDARGRIENALETAGDALDKALKSLDNDAANAAAIISESSARITQDGATATRFDGVVARTDTNAAAVTSEQTARTTSDGALGQRIDAVVARSDTAIAGVTSEQTARVSNDGVLAQRIDAVTAKTDSALAGVVSESSARITADGAIASRVDAVQARTDAGTATGRMTLSASSGVAGVTARFEMLLAAEVGGQTRGTGMTFDLLPGGGSLVRFDADKFVITSPGVSGVPAFSFDAGSGTLSVPYMRLLSQQASTPLRIDIGTYTLIAGAGTVNDQLDANLNFVYTVTNPEFPANIEVFGKLTLSGPAGTSLLGMRLVVDGTVQGYFKFNEQNTSVSVGPNNNTFDFRASCIRFLPAGNRSVRIQYTYTSPGAGQVQINELHLAGFQPKA